MDIKNKTIFITGGASGIGLAIAKKLLSEEVRVVIYSRNTDGLEKIFSPEFAERILIVKGDVTDRKQVRKAMDEAIKKFGSLDILINNAGVAKRENFMDTDEKDWDFVIDVNMKGVFICTQEYIKATSNMRHGTREIINIASGAGEYGVEKIAVYSATKAAVINIAQGLNEELKNLGIKWATVCPGSTDTKMFKNIFPEEKPYHIPEQVADVIYKTIIGEIEPDNRLIVDVFHHIR